MTSPLARGTDLVKLGGEARDNHVDGAQVGLQRAHGLGMRHAHQPPPVHLQNLWSGVVRVVVRVGVAW